MNRGLFVGVGLAIVMVLLVIGTGAAQGPEDPPLPDDTQQDASVHTTTSVLDATEALTSTFSYQGVLKLNSCTFTIKNLTVGKLFLCLDHLGR